MSETDSFDFQGHADRAVTEYLHVQSYFHDLAESVRRIVEEALRRSDTKVHSVQARAKDPRSVAKKRLGLTRLIPLDQVRQSRSGSHRSGRSSNHRIITYFPGTLPDIDRMLRSEFDVLEWSDKGQILLEEERFGYQSIHYLVRLKRNRSQLPEYERFRNAVTEVQLEPSCSMRGPRSSTISNTRALRSFL